MTQDLKDAVWWTLFHVCLGNKGQIFGCSLFHLHGIMTQHLSLKDTVWSALLWHIGLILYIVLCETTRKEMKSVLCETKICALRNKILHFVKEKIGFSFRSAIWIIAASCLREQMEFERYKRSKTQIVFLITVSRIDVKVEAESGNEPDFARAQQFYSARKKIINSSWLKLVLDLAPVKYWEYFEVFLCAEICMNERPSTEIGRGPCLILSM